jgi:hypothetical protein
MHRLEGNSQGDRLLPPGTRGAKAAWTPSPKLGPLVADVPGPLSPAADGTRRLHRALNEVLLGCGCAKQEGWDCPR